jgi:hypothetical protein
MGKNALRALRRKIGTDEGNGEDDDGQQQEYLDGVVNKEFDGPGETCSRLDVQKSRNGEVSEVFQHAASIYKNYFIYYEAAAGMSTAFSWGSYGYFRLSM